MKESDALICFFDLETTGLDVASTRIIQIGMRLVKCDRSIPERCFSSLINPQCPIPADIQQLTGITDEMVAGHVQFKDIAVEVFEMMLICDAISAYNGIRFDIPVIIEEFLRSGICAHECQRIIAKPVIDPGAIFQFKEPRDLKSAYKFYCGKEMEVAHRADADVMALVEVAAAQIDQYDLRGHSLQDLDKLSRRNERPTPDPAGKLAYNADGIICYNTFKNKGIPIEYDIGYAYWMLNKDFPEMTKHVIRDEIKRLETR